MLFRSVRISATDWVEGGIGAADAVEIARAFKTAGADLIDVSAGQTSIKARPVYGRMFQTPFSDRIRNEAGIATMAVGNITEIDHVNSIIAAGRADLCCLARPHLSDPYWTLHAAVALGDRGVNGAPYKCCQGNTVGRGKTVTAGSEHQRRLACRLDPCGNGQPARRLTAATCGGRSRCRRAKDSMRIRAATTTGR